MLTSDDGVREGSVVLHEDDDGGGDEEGDKGRPAFFAGVIELEKGVSAVNVATFLVVACATISLLVFLNVMQAFLLTNIYAVPLEDLGRISGTLQLIDEVWSIFMLALWGPVSDKFGRKVVVVAGFVQVSVALFLFPNGTQVFPDLAFIRLLYAQGAAGLATMLTTLIADYIAKDSLGKGNGMIGCTSGLGAILAVFVLAGAIPRNVCVTNTYYIVGGFSLFMALLSMFGLRGNKDRQNTKGGQREGRGNIFLMLRDGFGLSCNNALVALAYAAGFLSRGGAALLSIFISLWINRYYIANDLCDPSRLSNETLDNNEEFATCGGQSIENQDKMSCPAAFTQTAIVGGIAQTTALVGALAVGYMCDKIGGVKSVLVSSVLCFFFYGSALFISSPLSKSTYCIAVLWGLAEISMVITAQFLITQNMPSTMRGTVAGCYSLIGGLGVAFMAYLGGYLFDVWVSGAPFIVASIIAVLIAIGSLAVLFKR